MTPYSASEYLSFVLIIKAFSYKIKLWTYLVRKETMPTLTNLSD